MQQMLAQTDDQLHQQPQQPQLDFSADLVLEYYNVLQTAKSKAQKDQANKYIFEFTESTIAWKIAEEIITTRSDVSQIFIGCQVIFKKLENSFTDLNNDQEILQVRDKLFQILIRLTNGEQQISQDPKTVIERLAMSVAMIALRSTHSCWMSSITDIITFSGQNQQHCMIGLIILKHMCQLFDSQIFGRRSQQQIESYVRENINEVLVFINQVLLMEALPQKCHMEALAAVKAWCKFCTKTLVPNEQFIELLFKLLNNPTYFKKSVGIIKKLLVMSRHAKALENNNMEEAFSVLEEKDKRFLEIVILFLNNNQQKFLESCKDVEDDDATSYATTYCSLLTTLCSNYEVLLLQQSAASDQLFQAMYNAGSSPNLRIAIDSLDFWENFKETITSHVQDLNQKEYLFRPFIEITKILLVQSQKLDSIPYQTTEDAEIEELEQFEKGVSVIRFREFSSDIYAKTYCLLQKYYDENGEKLIYQIFIEGIISQQPNIYQIESHLFAARNIFDVFNDHYNESTLQFMKLIIDFLTESPLVTQHYIIAKSCVVFFIETAKILNNFQSLIQPTLNRLVNCYATFPQIQDLTIKAVFEVSQYCKCQFRELEFQLMFQALQSNFQLMSLENASKLMESICTVCSVLEDQQLLSAVQETCQLPIELMGKANDKYAQNKISEARLDMIKAINMLSACVTALDPMPSDSLKISLLPVIQDVWPQLCEILQTKVNDPELIDYTSTLIQKSIKAMRQEMVPFFSDLSQALLKCFNDNHKNFKCLRVYTFACTQLGKDPQIKQTIGASFDQLCQLILSKLNISEGIQNIDVDVAVAYAQLLQSFKALIPGVIISSPNFDSTIDLLSQTLTIIDQKELNVAIIMYFLVLVSGLGSMQEDLARKVISHFDKITVAFMAMVCKERSGWSGQSIFDRVALAFQSMITVCEILNLEQAMQQAFQASLSTPGFKDVSQKTKNIVINGLFVLNSEKQKIRLCLQQLNWVANRQSNEDIFLNIELQTKQVQNVKQMNRVNDPSQPIMIS